MEDFGFDINGLLSPEEAEEVFNENENKDTQEEAETEPESEEKETVIEEETEPLEKVGDKEEVKESAAKEQGDGSSPDSVYSSIAKALKNDGIFPDFEDSEIDGVTTPEDFAELFEKAITARQDDITRRINEALNNGVAPDAIRSYEQTLQYLGNVTTEAIESEDEAGENLRKQLIYNDLINRGYSQEKAARELEKSFKSGSDVDDAKDALEALTKFYKKEYDKVQEDAKNANEARIKAQKDQADKFKKMLLTDDVKFGDSVIDKKTCQKAYDAVSKPVYKDPDTGNLLTLVQKFQKENPLEFLKQLGLWYTLTDGGKNTSGLFKEQLRAEKNKGIKELERKINTTSLSSDGTLHLSTGVAGGDDVLLNGDWNVGWK